MENEVKNAPAKKNQDEAKPQAVPPKKRKKEPEVTIAPTMPGGPDISVE